MSLEISPAGLEVLLPLLSAFAAGFSAAAVLALAASLTLDLLEALRRKEKLQIKSTLTINHFIPLCT